MKPVVNLSARRWPGLRWSPLSTAAVRVSMKKERPNELPYASACGSGGRPVDGRCFCAARIGANGDVLVHRGVGRHDDRGNPSFEADKANPGQLLSGKYTGWTKISGDPAGISGTYGLGFSPIPQLPPGLASPSVIPPVGYTMASGGSQVLATWQDAVIGQTLQKSGGGNYSTAAHQTYVMTWEYAPGNVGERMGLDGWHFLFQQQFLHAGQQRH